MMLHNHTWIKDPVKVLMDQETLMLTKSEKFTDIVSGSVLQLTFKNLYYLSFDEVSKKESSQLSENLLIYSHLFQPHSCVRRDFLHIYHPKQHITTDCMQKQIQVSVFY